MSSPRPTPRAGPLPSNQPDGPVPARPERPRLESYGDGGFRISGVRFTGSVIILPETTMSWEVNDPGALRIESLSPVIDCEPRVEILLFGSGRTLQPIDETVRAKLQEIGIAIEPMDTGAACRTYSILAAEDRRVAAALIAVD